MRVAGDAFPATKAPSGPSRLLHWLTGAELRTPAGWLSSWANPRKPGYPYPEVSAYLLHLMARWPSRLPDEAIERRRELQHCVERQLIASGALERDGVDYVFDTAMGLAALSALTEQGLPVSEAAFAAGMDFVTEGVLRSAAHRSSGVWESGERWSLRFEAHLLKCLQAVRAPLRPALDAEARLMRLLDHQREDGAFALSNSDIVDVHVHAYALEGLLSVKDRVSEISRAVEAGTVWLAGIQHPDGGAPRHVPSSSPLACCDVTAQAIRLFLLTDRERHRVNIDRGFRFLERLEHPLGGFRYHLDSDDRPSWGAIFACQAALIRDGRHEAGDLV